MVYVMWHLVCNSTSEHIESSTCSLLQVLKSAPDPDPNSDCYHINFPPFLVSQSSSYGNHLPRLVVGASTRYLQYQAPYCTVQYTQHFTYFYPSLLLDAYHCLTCNLASYLPLPDVSPTKNKYFYDEVETFNIPSSVIDPPPSFAKNCFGPAIFQQQLFFSG